MFWILLLLRRFVWFVGCYLVTFGGGVCVNVPLWGLNRGVSFCLFVLDFGFIGSVWGGP